MQVPNPLRVAADAFAESSGLRLERMVIHRDGNEAWFTIKDNANFYHAVLTIRHGGQVVDISPQRPLPETIKRLGRETAPPE